MNSDCINYKLALEENIVECPACGKPATKTGKTANDKLALGAIIGGLAGIMLWWIIWGTAGIIIGLSMIVGSVVTAFISRSKAAVVVSFIFLAAIVGLMLSIMNL